MGDTVEVEVVGNELKVVENLDDPATGQGGVSRFFGATADGLMSEVRDLVSGAYSRITQTAEEILSEVGATYLAQDDAEDAYASKSSVSQTAASIRSEVARTYLTSSGAASTYATKTSLTQTSTDLTALITAAQGTADGADAVAGELSTMVRAYAGGVLVCKTGNAVGALVSADGSFDVVAVTWRDGEPTAGKPLSTFGQTARIGLESGLNATVTDSGLSVNYPGSKSVYLTNRSSARYLAFNGAPEDLDGDYNDAIGWNSVLNGSTGKYGSAVKMIAGMSTELDLWSGNLGDPALCLYIGNSHSAMNGVFSVSRAGNVECNKVNSTSDRRLKDHKAYLAEEAAGFVRSLKPALYEKDGSTLTGFYAQDVAGADPWGSDIVSESRMSEQQGFKPLTLDYQALIAPLVAYCQQLEARIEQIESKMEGEG